MNRTPEQWALIKPDAFLDGSIVQARNVIEMMQRDIAELSAVASHVRAESAAEIADLQALRDVDAIYADGQRAEIERLQYLLRKHAAHVEYDCPVDAAAS